MLRLSFGGEDRRLRYLEADTQFGGADLQGVRVYGFGFTLFFRTLGVGVQGLSNLFD